jgi:tRNA (mo5U34)-methyltransferase
MTTQLELAQYRQDCKRVLQEMGPENIWRPVYDEHGNLLADGHEDMRSTTPDDLTGVDYQGRTVLDLGCNLGTYSFLAKRRGAVTVVGVDSDPLAIRGCNLLAKLYGLDSMQFTCADLTNLDGNKTYDIVQLINFVGRRSIVKGIQPLLNVCLRSAREFLVLSIRCQYPIRNGLSVEPAYMEKKYGKKYVLGEFFDAATFVLDYFNTDYSQLSPDYEDKTLKRTFLFRFSI